MDNEKFLKNVPLDVLFDIYAVPDLPAVPADDGSRDKCRCILLLSRLTNDMREFCMRHISYPASMFYAVETIVEHLRTLYHLDDDRLE